MNLLRILFFTFISLLSLKSYSTHIVGGVVYYEYLGNNKVKLYFEIYRDCDRNKEVQIGFDGHDVTSSTNQLPPFYFSVFVEGGGANNIWDKNELTIKSRDIQEIRSVIVNKCLTKDGTCVEKGVYTTTITINDLTRAHIVQYQRCCRNDGIVNIRNQVGNNDKPGITIKTRIPPLNSIINNSAKFKNFPPIFICKDRPFIFDHSATDIDGDTLRYYLSTPLAGLNSDNPASKFQVEGKDPVVWQNPYSKDNMIGGTPRMSVDSITGLLVCNPDRVGRFVVSIEVHEIRGGKIINKFARDFQYNVRPCDIPYANTPYVPGTLNPNTREALYVLDCDNLKVDFVSTSQNATSYLWEFGDGNTSTQKNPTHTYAVSGTYNVTHYAYKTVNGQLCEDKVTRIVEKYPKLEARFTSVGEKCVNEQISFTNQSISTHGTINKYRWEFGDGTSSNSKSPNKTYTTSGTYTVKLTIENDKGCEAEYENNIIVLPLPVINNVDIKGCFGQEKSIDCDVTIENGTIVNYLWTLPDGSTNSNCSFNFTPNTNGALTFNLEVESDKGCIASKNIPYTVHPLPNVVTINDARICYNGSINLTTTGAQTYSWTPTKYLDNPTASDPLCTPIFPDSTIYFVEGIDGNGCKNYDTVKISFFEKLTIDAGPDTSVCLNPSSPNNRSTVQLNGTIDANNVNWTPTNFLNNANIKNPTSTPTDNITYYFNATDINNCEYRDSLTVYVLNPDFNLIVPDSNYICKFDSIQVSAKDQGAVSTYVWNPKFWVSDDSIRNPFFKPLNTIDYILTLSNYCYTKNDTITIYVHDLPEPGLLDLDSICLGEVYRKINIPQFPTILWTTTDTSLSSNVIHNPTLSPVVTSEYKVFVIDSNGCENKDSITIEVNYPPSISILGLRSYICQGDTLDLKLITDKFANIAWNPTNYLVDDSGYFNRAFPFDTTEFYIEAISLQGCVNHDSFIINVQKLVQPFVKSPLEMCVGEFVNLKAEGGLYYLWKPSDFLNDTIIDTPQANPPNFQNYIVYISNDCFIDSATVDVYVHYPTPIKAYSDTTIYRGASVDLYAETDAPLVDWSPKNEISNPLSKTITVVPRDTMQYIAHTVNQFNCSSYDTIVVNVYGKDVLLIPTAFSPNGDGNNDYFGIVKHLNIQELQSFEVYNRWGELVFSTTDIEEQWDGTYNDEKSMNGVYVWKVKALTYDNESIIKSGNVTLIR